MKVPPSVFAYLRDASWPTATADAALLDMVRLVSRYMAMAAVGCAVLASLPPLLTRNPSSRDVPLIVAFTLMWSLVAVWCGVMAWQAAAVSKALQAPRARDGNEEYSVMLPARTQRAATQSTGCFGSLPWGVWDYLYDATPPSAAATDTLLADMLDCLAFHAFFVLLVGMFFQMWSFAHVPAAAASMYEFTKSYGVAVLATLSALFSAAAVWWWQAAHARLIGAAIDARNALRTRRDARRDAHTA